MRYFFISEIPCFLTENGKYLGIVNKNLKYIDISENSLLSFNDLSGENYTVYATEKDYSQVKLFEVDDYKICIPIFKKKRNFPFRVIFQKDYKIYSEILKLTVYLDGSIKYTFDGLFFDSQELPFYPDNINVEFYENYVIASFASKTTAIFVYEILNDKTEIVYKNVVDNFSIQNSLSIKKTYGLIIPTLITETWDFSNPLTLSRRTTEFDRDIKSVKTPLKNTLFFELVSIRAEISNFLSDSLKERVEDLYSFIGNPVFVLPSPKNIYETLIITNEKASVYSVETDGELITNIKEND